jgi:hypothetical protein
MRLGDDPIYAFGLGDVGNPRNHLLRLTRRRGQTFLHGFEGRFTASANEH